MAITSGVGDHRAWLNVGGSSFLLEGGSVSQSAEKTTSSFSGVIPMSMEGAQNKFSTMAAGEEATITVETRGQTATLITGSIDTVRFDYIQRKIRFMGRDKSAKLHEEVSSEKHINKKPSEIVKELTGRVGLTGNIAESKVYAGKKLEKDYVKLTQNHSFSKIIHEMARIDGARWWIDPTGQFHYEIGDSQNNTYTINFDQSNIISSDCLQLNISHNLQAGRPTEIEVEGFHPKKRKVISSTAKVGGSGPKRKITYQVPTIDEEQAESHAKSEVAERSRQQISVSVTVVGDPSVHAGMKLQINGTDFDQTLDIDTVSHTFGMGGHVTHISSKAAKEGRDGGGGGELPDVDTSPTAEEINE